VGRRGRVSPRACRRQTGQRRAAPPERFSDRSRPRVPSQTPGQLEADSRLEHGLHEPGASLAGADAGGVVGQPPVKVQGPVLE
jgi:hypothetical protein